jgi:ribosome maturation factor RimP
VSSKEVLWQTFEPIAQSLGLEIFELEVPNTHSRVLRIFLAKARGLVGHVSESVELIESLEPIGEGVVGEMPAKPTVSLDECAKFSKALSRTEGFDDLFDGNWTLEVSSPGINRRLSRPEHFEAAVGERVKVKFRGSEEPDVVGRNVVARGVLTQFDGETLTVEDEERGAPVTVAYGQVNEARVDFLFTSKR